MNINQLRYFMTVAQLENISRAAELLYLNQPALSKSIGKLEEELGTPLFDRNGKKLSLNPQGERFLECTSVILRELELAENDLKRISSGSSQRIRIGAAGCAAKLIDCTAAFRREHPECSIEFDFSIESAEMPDINDYDALVYPEGVKYEKFAGYPFGTEQYLLAASRQHPLAALPLITVRHLSDQDFVFLRHGKFDSDYPLRVCTALNIPFRSVCYTDSRQSQMQIIATGMAVGLIPEGAQEMFSEANLRLVPLDSKRFSREMRICFKRDKHLSPIGKAFRDMTLRRIGANVIVEERHETL